MTPGEAATLQAATLQAATLEAAALLTAAGVEDPRREARLILAHAAATGLDAGPLVARRAAREPMAFITGTRGFWTIDVAVSPDTLIPRPDSETLIEAAIAAFPDRSRVGRILDLGTGTGCLLLAALTEFPIAWGLGIDFSPGAASLARRNATLLGLADRAVFVCADWSAPVRTTFDLILCNPPYIEAAVIPGLMPEVGRHEPRRALDGGQDGLDAYRCLIPAIPALLAPGGVAILELGAGQSAAVTTLAEAAGLVVHAARFDLGGIARALPVTKKPFGGPAVVD